MSELDHCGNEKQHRCLLAYWGAGGAGVRTTMRMARGLSGAFGTDSLAISLHGEAHGVDDAETLAADVVRLHGPVGRHSPLRMLATLPSRLLQFFRQARRCRAEALIIPMNFAQALPVALAARLMGMRVIYGLHDAVPHPGDYSPALQKFTQAGLVRLAQIILTFSGHAAQAAAQRYPAQQKRITSIPLAALAERRVDKPRQLGGPPVRFLFLGRLLAYKGLDLLGEAARALGPRDDWKLTIAGEGPLEAFVRAQFSDDPRIDLSRLGWIPEEDVDALMAAHDVLVCPYTEASQSGVIAEAQAWAVPSLVTPVGALPEQIGQGRAGWIVEGATGKALAARMADIIGDADGYAARSAHALALAGAAEATVFWKAIIGGGPAAQRPDHEASKDL